MRRLNSAILRVAPQAALLYVYWRNLRRQGDGRRERKRMFRDFVAPRSGESCLQIGVRGKKFGSNWVSVDLYDPSPEIDYHCDVAELPFADNTFDGVMVGFGIRNVTHMAQGFQEMYRVLKPGGHFMCLEFSKPRNAVFRVLYDFYSFAVMPLLGELIAGSRQAYTHLPETIRLFPLPDELAAILTEIGFSRVGFRSLTNGIAVIHHGVKPDK